MSPLPGGPADKIGNRYEVWWTVSQLLRIIKGIVESIKIEDPSTYKTEFTVVDNGKQELHQAKMSHSNGKWTLKSLENEGILCAIFEQIKDNDNEFIFVSGSDAPKFRELTERSRQAKSFNEFKTSFISPKTMTEKFNKLKESWKKASDETVYGVLKRIKVEIISERQLHEKVESDTRCLFVGNAEKIKKTLYYLVVHSVHKTLTKDIILETLKKDGFLPRKIESPESVPLIIKGTTSKFFKLTQRKLINQKIIPRYTTDLIIDKIYASNKGIDIFLTGIAGTGKTGCVIELVEVLEKKNIPVLYFRLDRIKAVSTSYELGKEIGLEESPAIVLNALEGKDKAVLIIDQLDAISKVSGRNDQLFDSIEELMEEVSVIREKFAIDIVLCCRKFDLNNDHRLRRLLKESQEIEVPQFSLKELKTILTNNGYNFDQFGKEQRELLQLPQNLSIFIDSNIDNGKVPAFKTVKEILDLYWDEKRTLVVEKAKKDEWCDVINLICDKMVESQQLSVIAEKLDGFSQTSQLMASEGVLSFDKKRYSFGHESFFDYCFARSFIRKGDQKVLDYLLSTGQQLFFRQQVRQILEYLKDLDRDQYNREIKDLLENERVRIHIKDVVLALIFSSNDPNENEWELLSPYIDRKIQKLKKGVESEGDFETLIWHHFFRSSSWFRFVKDKGLINEWISEGGDQFNELIMRYLAFHQKNYPKLVLSLLAYLSEDLAKRGKCLKHYFENFYVINDRGIFDIFVNLLDKGYVCDFKDENVSENISKRIFYSLSNTNISWLSEVLAHFLRGILDRETPKKADREEWRNIFGFNSSLFNYFTKASSNPEVFINNLLPVVLKIAELSIDDKDKSLPRYDIIGGSVFYESDRDFLRVFANSIKDLSDNITDQLVSVLKQHKTAFANHLLLKLFNNKSGKYADVATEILCNQSWRLDCGYSDSSYWVAGECIRSIFPKCSLENRSKIEKTIIEFFPDYERSKSGYQKHSINYPNSFNHASYVLLSFIPIDLISPEAKKRFLELERKFGKKINEPKKLEAGFVQSPIKYDNSLRMTDQQWLKAIKKYSQKDRARNLDNPWKGGASQLAYHIGEMTKDDPLRFASLSLNFPDGTNSLYFSNIIRSLEKSEIAIETKLAVCRRAFRDYKVECACEIADLIGNIKEEIPENDLKMITWIATEHPEPLKTGRSSCYGGSIHNYGLNTARGRAAEAIGELVFNDSKYIGLFKKEIGSLVNDKSISVRSCAGLILLGIFKNDESLSIELFKQLAKSQDIELLSTIYVNKLIWHLIPDHFNEIKKYIEEMFYCDVEDVSKTGSTFICLASFYGHEVNELIEKALNGTVAQRLGVASVASRNIGNSEYRDWCEHHLKILFNDEDEKVRKSATSVFFEIKDLNSEDWTDLIVEFSKSLAFGEDSFTFLNVLENSVLPLPNVTLDICSKFVEQFGKESRDIRTHHAANAPKILDLIFRVYSQNKNSDLGQKVLDLIDHVTLYRVYTSEEQMKMYERMQV